MRKDHSHRVLTVGAQQYLWRTYHQHAAGCVEVLRLRQLGSVAGVTLVFRPDGERNIPDGGVSSAGVIWIGDRFLNLNMPGVVRAFVDGAVRRGWMDEARTVGRRNGWDLFDEAYARSGKVDRDSGSDGHADDRGRPESGPTGGKEDSGA